MKIPKYKSNFYQQMFEKIKPYMKAYSSYKCMNLCLLPRQHYARLAGLGKQKGTGCHKVVLSHQNCVIFMTPR